MFAWHDFGDFVHCLDDFVERDEVGVAAEGHVCAGKGVGGGHDVAAEAGCLDAVGDWVTDHAEVVLEGHRCGAELLIVGATGEEDDGGGEGGVAGDETPFHPSPIPSTATASSSPQKQIPRSLSDFESA